MKAKCLGCQKEVKSRRSLFPRPTVNYWTGYAGYSKYDEYCIDCVKKEKKKLDEDFIHPDELKIIREKE